MSYDCVLQLITDIGNKVCKSFRCDGVVCPGKMHSAVFTSAVVDSIDYNSSYATAKDALHGTGISLIQQFTNQSVGYDHGVVIMMNHLIPPSPFLLCQQATQTSHQLH